MSWLEALTQTFPQEMLTTNCIITEPSKAD